MANTPTYTMTPLSSYYFTSMPHNSVKLTNLQHPVNQKTTRLNQIFLCNSHNTHHSDNVRHTPLHQRELTIVRKTHNKTERYESYTLSNDDAKRTSATPKHLLQINHHEKKNLPRYWQHSLSHPC